MRGEGWNEWVDRMWEGRKTVDGMLLVGPLLGLDGFMCPVFACLIRFCLSVPSCLLV